MTRRADRLERVLRVRVIEEELARGAWQAAEGTARAAEDRAQDLRSARAQMTADLGRALPELTPSWVLLSQRQIERTQSKLHTQDERARTLRRQAEAAREPWQERRSVAQGLSRLVERAHLRAREEVLALEARLLDEITAARGLRDRLRLRSER